MRSTRHLVDPQLRSIADSIPPNPLTLDSSVEEIQALRQALESQYPAAGSMAIPGVTKTERTVAGLAGEPDVRFFEYRPSGIDESADQCLPLFFHIHGGGYLLGSPEHSEGQHYLFAAQLNCIVVSVDYRLAPETKAPGSVRDCYAALRWLYANAEEQRIDTSRIVIGGESAGGGLAAALAIMARDEAEVPIALQWLIYPMLDDRTAVRGGSEFTGEYVWNAKSNRIGWTALLDKEPGSAGISSYEAPARETNYEGLPPTYIAVGALDLFLEENVDYAMALLKTGVNVELHIIPGAFHAFEMASMEVELVKASMDHRFAALARAFGRSVQPLAIIQSGV